MPFPVFESLRDSSVRTGYSTPIFREKIRSGELPAYRIGDKPNSPIRVRISDVDALLKPVVPTQAVEQ